MLHKEFRDYAALSRHHLKFSQPKEAEMPEKTAGQILLESAYRLSTPKDNEEYYDEFAASYDGDFADTLGWFYPAAISTAYRNAATTSDIPIADIGCGTGLVASALDLPKTQIDGIDISAEMLRIAKGKKLYGSLYKADLSASLDEISNDYGAVVSAGTFTSGHLGPEPLEPLLGIARSGALFVIGVKRQFFKDADFEPVLRSMEASGLIHDLQVVEVPMYTKDGHDHSNDVALVLIYRKS
jgi:SAM-dependent methyltransferase